MSQSVEALVLKESGAIVTASNETTAMIDVHAEDMQGFPPDLSGLPCTPINASAWVHRQCLHGQTPPV